MEKSSQTSGALIEPLTRRETDILTHLAANRTNQEIARLEHLAPSTVKWYVNQILGKLNAKSREQAVARSIELGLIPPEVQPEKTSALPRNNLPRQLSSFIGREGEIAQLAGLVRANPLVTVTGSGGVGKTRLALETASRLLPHFSNGVWLVELAPLSNPELVPQTVVSTFGVMGKPSLLPIKRLCEYLAARQVLLVLDNCEHVIGAAAELALALLQACPRLSILATSREILGLKGETVYRCPSLSLPIPSEDPADSFSNLSTSGAVQLFSERAASVTPVFAVNETNAADVVRICQGLDGIPLAIELAAARLRILSPMQIAERLDDIFSLLAPGSRTDLPRQRTLEATIDWSYNLLSVAERRLLLRLSIFAGSWNLEAAEAVCGSLPGERILDLLGQLVDKSLMEAFPGPGGMRYRMLETIRQFARERLIKIGDVTQLRERHLDYYLTFSLEAETKMIGPSLREWRELVDVEIDNLRAAMEWSLSGRVEKGLRLVAALHWYWHGRSNFYNEELSWLERFLEREAAGPEDLRGEATRRVARGKAINSAVQREIKNSVALACEASKIFSQMGDAYRLDWAVAMIWSREMDLLDVLSIFREIGDQFWISNVLWELSMPTMSEGDLLQARQYLEESLVILRKIGYSEGEGATLCVLSGLEFLLGRPKLAIDMLDRGYKCFEKAGNLACDYMVNNNRAQIAFSQGNYLQAEHYYQLSLADDLESELMDGTVFDLGNLSWIAWESGQHDHAKQLLNEALRLAEKWGNEVDPTVNLVSALVVIEEGNYSQAYTYLSSIMTTPFINVPLVVEVYAVLAAAIGKMEHAAVLFGCLDAYPWLANMLPPTEREGYRQALAAVRAALSADDFAAAWAQGQAMKASQALDYARANASDA